MIYDIYDDLYLSMTPIAETSSALSVLAMSATLDDSSGSILFRAGKGAENLQTYQFKDDVPQSVASRTWNFPMSLSYVPEGINI